MRRRIGHARLETVFAACFGNVGRHVDVECSRLDVSTVVQQRTGERCTVGDARTADVVGGRLTR